METDGPDALRATRRPGSGLQASSMPATSHGFTAPLTSTRSATAPPPPAIRPATLDDVDALVALECASFDADRISRRSFRNLLQSRSALVLVAAQGMTYEAAAEMIGCQVGTMKSRVSRARSYLIGSLGMEPRQAAAT